MKQRYYVNMVAGSIKEVPYTERASKRPTHIYASPVYEVHVFGYFNRSKMNRQKLDYAVMLFAIEKDQRVKELVYVS